MVKYCSCTLAQASHAWSKWYSSTQDTCLEQTLTLKLYPPDLAWPGPKIPYLGEGFGLETVSGSLKNPITMGMIR
jgi:hypothetical protein